MKKFDQLTLNAVFAGQVLLLFLLVFERFIHLPPGLQVVGRMHPLLLHLPIGLWVLLGAVQLFIGREVWQSAAPLPALILNLTALTATATALMGIFLSREEGYEGDLLVWHQWTGATVSFLTYGLLLIRRSERLTRQFFPPVLGAGLVLVVLTGHFGAGLTHGRDFLWAPLRPAPAPVTEATPLFDAAVAPILEQRCTGCHNERKAKGGLIMTSAEALLKGGKNGALWTGGAPDSSLLMKRLLLPPDHEEHMPPTGKPQLTDAEIQLLHAWIADGADRQRPLGDYPSQDTLRQLAERLLGARLQQNAGPVYDFPPAPAATIQRLNSPFRAVTPVASGSPALQAVLFVREAYQSSSLTDLLEVKNQLVSLNLSNLPISDKDLATIAKFRELRNLVLNGTSVTGTGLSDLQACTQLQSLALAGTNLDTSRFPDLTQFSSLQKLYLWDTPFSSAQIKELAHRYPHIEFSTGYVPDKAEWLPLGPPQVLNEKQVLNEGENITLRHTLPGTVVRYTLDGSDPDSLSSPVYEHPISISSSYTLLKAKAYRDHWLSSPVAVFSFFRLGYQPRQLTLQHSPDPQYQGNGPPTLSDGVKGVVENFRSPAWLGFREQPLVALADFGDAPPQVSQITLSYARKIDSYIMPPLSVEVWAGQQEGKLQLLKRIRPEQPSGYLPNQIAGLAMDIPVSAFRYYRIVAEPVPRLPAWHSGKGDKGWLFVDEILFNGQ